MKLKVIGSGREVGRSAILLDRVMLDFGVRIEPTPPKYAEYEPCDAAVITHAHLDHSGAAPILTRKHKIPIFMTDVTLELTALLIRDSMKIARKEGFNVPFSKRNFRAFLRNSKFMGYGEKFKAAGLRCSLHSSGHIPGSSSVLVEGKKKVLYTSDFQTVDSKLLYGCRLPKKCDVLVVESTYGNRDQKPRQEEEKSLLNSVEEAMSRNETVLLPVFAVGRAQEVLMILENYSDMIALDGMAKTASDIISEYSAYLRDPKTLTRVLNKIHFVDRGSDRAAIAEKFPIIVSSAGMLGGGPAVSYLRSIANRDESKILFSGFLVEDTPGRHLLETKIFQNSEERFRVKCEVRQFELSGHADRQGIFDAIEHTKPGLVVCVHGDACEKFAEDIQEEFKIDAIAPKNGEEIRI